MAEEKLGALPVDVSKVAGYGVAPESLQALRDALAKNVEALEQRYAQPNWFNVAAGFLKPQLGGFAASLGSAAGAMGENVERARATQLPIAQMRAQLAQADIVLGQNKKVADMEAARKAAGKPLTPEYVSEVTALAPESTVAKALANELTTRQKQQDLLMQSINLKVARGMPLTPEEQALLGTLPTTGKTQPPGAPTEGAAPAPGTPTTAGVTAPAKEEPKEPQYYPMTITMPDVSGMSTAQMEATKQLYADQASKQESAYQDKFNSLAAIASGPNYTNTRNLYDTTIGMMQNNPQLTGKVFNIIRSNGQIAAALNAGIGVSMGGWGASLNLPVKPFLEAGFTRDEQKFADLLTTNLTQLAAAKLKAAGMTTANTTQSEYMTQMKSAAHLDQAPETAFLNVMKDRANFDLGKESYDTIVNERKTKVNPQSLTKLTDVYQNSPRLKELEEKYRRINERLDREFQRSIGAKQ